MIRLAVIGAGRHSTRCHGPALKYVNDARPGRIELAAVCDLVPGKAREYADKFGFHRAYQDLKTLLDREKPDGIIAVTPLDQTESIAGLILEARVPVLIEKPPGRDSAAAARLAEVAERTGTPHMVSFNRRFSPAVAEACAWLARQTPRLPPWLVLGRMLRHARREPNFAVETGIHLVDAVLSFTPRPIRVRTQRLEGAVPGSHLFDVRMTCDGGAVAGLLIAPEVGHVEETYEVYGRDYSLVIDAWTCSFRAFEGDRLAVHWQAPADAPAVFRDGTLGEMEAFVRSLEWGLPHRPNLRDALASMRVAEAIQAGLPDYALPAAG